MRRFFKTLMWLFVVTLLGQHMAHAQIGRMNLPNFDARPYHFGFILSGNQSDFKFAVADSLGPTFQGVANQPQGGFNMHLMASYTLTRHLRVRFVPGLSFQERALRYRFAGNAEQLERTSAVNLDVPLLLKWRTDRMTNVAAYALGGVKYLRDFQSQEDVRQEEDILKLRSGNVALDLGAGIDIFLPFFKLAIQAKTEHGLLNVLLPGQGELTSPLEFLRTRSFVLSVCFEG